MRGSTALAERLGPTPFATLLNRFYKVATDILVPLNAVIEKMIGDEVMAFFRPVSGPEYRQNAVRAARQIARAVGYGGAEEPWLPVGVGVHTGPAYVGKVGTSGV